MAEQKAAYRFLQNGKVSEADILRLHRQALLERVRLESTVLLVEHTTTLNYTSLRGSARGRFVHAAVAFTEGRRPLGVSELESRARPESEPQAESRRWLRGFDQGRELGRMNLGRRVVVVGDRESDIYELLHWQNAHREEAPGWRCGQTGAGSAR